MSADFLVIGAQKCGTTALDMYLRQHPNIVMPASRKELHFFDRDECFKPDGRADYSEYEKALGAPRQSCVRGEITPIYLYWRDAALRIFRYNPSIKIVALLRDPVERAFSHWNMERTRRTEHLEFSQAIRDEPSRLAAAPAGQHRVYSYVARGHYAAQLKNYWNLFDREQILLLNSEDLSQRPLQTLNKLCGFLRIPAYKDIDPMRCHELPYSAPMSAEDRAYLQNLYSPGLLSLASHVDWDLSGWIEPLGNRAANPNST